MSAMYGAAEDTVAKILEESSNDDILFTGNLMQGHTTRSCKPALHKLVF